jgi:hypothetical protein
MRTLMTALLLTAAAHASPEGKEKTLRSYHPEIQFQKEAAGWSLKGCPLTRVSIQGKDPVHGKMRLVTLKEYSPQANLLAAKTILVLPPTGGENMIDRGWGNTLCSAGFRVLLLQRWENDDFQSVDLSMHDTNALRALSAVRHAVEFAQKTGARDIGILGTSVGALSAALALGVEARISSGVLITGGLGMAEIIAHSTEAGAAKLRNARMEKFGFKSVQDYRDALSRAVTIEPGEFIGHSGPKRVFAVLGLKDITVPLRTQRELVEKFRAEETLELPGDHVNSIMNTYWYHSEKIVDFFRKTLG